MASRPIGTIAEFANRDTVQFSTRGHPKAKGAVFSIKVPRSWAFLEGERPNIVQKFVSRHGKGLEMGVIITKAIPGTMPLSPTDMREFLSPAELKDTLPTGAKLIGAKATMIEAQPATLMEFNLPVERAGYSLDAHVLSLTFFSGRTFVQVQFQIMGSVATPGQVDAKFQAFRPLFDLMMNSIVFEGKWR